MNKADLVNLVAARTELTKTDVSLVVDAAIETIVDSVVEGKKVSILGFGSFEPRDRSARQGLNPKTGEKIAIPCLLYTSPSPRDGLLSRMPSSA